MQAKKDGDDSPAATYSGAPATSRARQPWCGPRSAFEDGKDIALHIGKCSHRWGIPGKFRENWDISMISTNLDLESLE